MSRECGPAHGGEAAERAGAGVMDDYFPSHLFFLILLRITQYVSDVRQV
jgi:hypothetical protein